MNCEIPHISSVASIIQSVNIILALRSSATKIPTYVSLSSDFSSYEFGQTTVANRLVMDACVKRYFRTKKTKTHHHSIERIRRCRSENLWNSNWGIQLLHPNFNVPGSWQWKRFRNRFRMPPDSFSAFVQECRLYHIFGVAKRFSRIALEFKVMACLRILARDAVGDDIDEHLNIGNSYLQLCL